MPPIIMHAPKRRALRNIRERRPGAERDKSIRRSPDYRPALGAPGVGMAHSESALAGKLSSFIRLSPEELDCLSGIQSKPSNIAAGTDLVHEGQTDHRAYILQGGWAYSYKILPEGARQIITFSVPGDFLGMRSILLRTSDLSFAAVTDIVVSSIALPRISRVFKAHPRVGVALLWAVARDEAIAIEHLVGLGRRNSVERVAHFFLELGERLQLIGLGTETTFECPLNQYFMGDALGLTPVHVNRVLRRLREQGLLTVRDQRVVIEDVRGLRKLAGYDGEYLDQPSDRFNLAT